MDLEAATRRGGAVVPNVRATDGARAKADSAAHARRAGGGPGRVAARHGHNLLLAHLARARGARPERNEDGARAPHFAARAGGHARYPAALDRRTRLWRRAAARDDGDDATNSVRVAGLVEHPAGRPLDAGGRHLVASGLRRALDRLLRAGAARHSRERRGPRPARVGWARLVQDGALLQRDSRASGTARSSSRRARPTSSRTPRRGRLPTTSSTRGVRWARAASRWSRIARSSGP